MNEAAFELLFWMRSKLVGDLRPPPHPHCFFIRYVSKSAMYRLAAIDEGMATTPTTHTPINSTEEIINMNFLCIHGQKMNVLFAWFDALYLSEHAQPSTARAYMQNKWKTRDSRKIFRRRIYTKMKNITRISNVRRVCDCQTQISVDVKRRSQSSV